MINFKLDTGAEVNVLPLRYFKRLNDVTMCKSQVVLEAYGGSSLKVLGETELVCCAKNEICVARFFIVNSDTMPILGLNACVDLNLIKRVHTVESQDKGKFINENRDVFEGMGCFVENFEIKLKDGAEPVAHPARRIPLTVMKPLKSFLKDLEDQEIIARVDEGAEWVSNVVIVEKKDKSLRICLDPKELNAAIKNENYIIPSFDELSAKLANKKYFTVLDLKNGYWQMKLSEASSKLCTFSTPFGCYRFLRLPFGIKIAGEVFQKYNERNFMDIPNVIIYIDDILICADSLEEHDKTLMRVIERARDLNVKFNKEKVQYRVKSVKFLGNVISEEGIACDPERMKGISDIQIPQNKKDLQKMFGMINYIRNFVPDLSNISAPLRELLKKNVIFQWLPKHTKCFEEIKNLIMNTPILRPIDLHKQISIQADSSKDGLGCCIMQEGRPVSFASRSLTDCEKNYSQIEKELLAICFACTKYHKWIYGRKIKVYTDHKPLLGILNKPIPKIPCARLARMRIRLLKYDIELFYTPGKYMYIADVLSRFYDKTNKGNEITDLNEVVHSINVSEAKKKIFQTETERDPVLGKLKEVMINGWPQCKSQLNEEVKYYWKFQDDIFLDDGILFMNEKIIVPVSLRTEMLSKLHEAHLGIEKTKARAREIFYWPGLSQCIEDMVAKCQICQKFRKGVQAEPMINHDIPQYPFYKIAMDICEIGKSCYLSVSDYYSKYLEIIELKSKRASEIIKKLKSVFATHGIPRIIVSDNQPFNSFEFNNFSKQYDIEMIFSSPRYPQSNGQAESAVQITKKLIKKANEENKEVWLALSEYRNTPIKDLDLSPNELLMSRRTRTLIPSKMSTFDRRFIPNLNGNFQFKQQKSRTYYNRNVRHRDEFIQGQVVWYQNGGHWVKAMIVNKDKAPRSYWIELENGKILRRNSRWLRFAK